MGGQETDVWVANVPADVARLFRACLCSVARRMHAGPGHAPDALVFELPVGRFASGDRVL
jgi:hypothetical protein